MQYASFKRSDSGYIPEMKPPEALVSTTGPNVLENPQQRKVL